MSNLSTFQFNPTTQLRVVDSDWFVASDVCNGLDIKDSAQAVRYVKNQLKQAGIEGTFSKRTLVKSNSGTQETIIVNEPCLNMLIMQSRKKSAIQFKYWIASEVLPSIRKTGSYTLPQDLTPEQQHIATQRVHQIVARSHLRENPLERSSHQIVWGSVKKRFKVAKYSQIPSSKFDELMEYLGGETKAVELVNQYDDEKILVNRQQYQSLTHMVNLTRNKYEALREAMREANSAMTGIHDAVRETPMFIQRELNV